MDEEIELLPSPEVDNLNVLERIAECRKYFDENKHTPFLFLWGRISKYFDKTEATEDKWTQFRADVISSLTKELEATTVFDEYIATLKSLQEILNNPKELWDILHSKLNCQLKVTLQQDHIISTTFFSPSMLFEYGFDAFVKSALCDFSNITNEEALIDIFYAMAGYVRACDLDKQYESRLQSYEEFITKLLTYFIELQDFDAHRFVWLVEAIHKHLHLSSTSLRLICEKVVDDYVNQDEEKQTIGRLLKVCIISTSPFLHQLPLIKESINNLFLAVIDEQRTFLRKYIFGCFYSIDWNSRHPCKAEFSMPFKCWRLYLMNLASRIQHNPDLPNLLLKDFLDDSLVLFDGYYGDVQPSRERAILLRVDLLGIVELISLHYPVEFSNDTLRRMWYLLYIVAVCGARNDEIAAVKPCECEESQHPFLGLEKSGCDFIDYKLALGRLCKIFENESESLPSMVKFIRAKYDDPRPAQDTNQESEG